MIIEKLKLQVIRILRNVKYDINYIQERLIEDDTYTARDIVELFENEINKLVEHKDYIEEMGKEDDY